MLRLLVLLLLAYLVYRGIESLMGQLRGSTGGATFRPVPPPAPRMTVTVRREGAEELVPCARCGVRVPKSRTVAGEGGAVVCGSCAEKPRI